MGRALAIMVILITLFMAWNAYQAVRPLLPMHIGGSQAVATAYQDSEGNGL